MTTPTNPFAKTKAKAGQGEIVLSKLPPGKQVLTTFEYQYPLKLISPDSHHVTIDDPDHNAKTGTTDPSSTKTTIEHPITTVFLLTYGGGLLAGDSINLSITLNPATRLALLTQGSTKIFKAKSTSTFASPALPPPPKPGTFAPIPTSSVPPQDRPTSQTLNVRISAGATLVYLPDPSQPFAKSTYTQHQTFYVSPYGSSSLLFLDWVSEGRTALGEKWTLTSWKGRNEIRELDETSNSNSNSQGTVTKGRLLLRDSLLLFGDEFVDLHAKTDGKGILGTLVVGGPVWIGLGEWFMREFRALRRIGAKNWMTTGTVGGVGQNGHAVAPGGGSAQTTPKEQDGEEVEGLLWTAAQVRGFVLVKFAARDVDGARRWLGGMLRREGSVEREFGHQALLCLK